jgi:hypothetical protein
LSGAAVAAPRGGHALRRTLRRTLAEMDLAKWLECCAKLSDRKGEQNSL